MRYDFARSPIACHPTKFVFRILFRETAVADKGAEAVRGNAAYDACMRAGSERIGVAHLAIGELYRFRAAVLESPIFSVAGNAEAVGSAGLE